MTCIKYRQAGVFEDMENKCYLVKFTRMQGNVLHFGRMLKELMSRCGYFLTGVPNNQFEHSERDKQTAEEFFRVK